MTDTDLAEPTSIPLSTYELDMLEAMASAAGEDPEDYLREILHNGIARLRAEQATEAPTLH